MHPVIPVPISTDEHGAIRVANTRVTLDVLIAAYQQGDTPEEIHQGLPTLRLADIYAVITYYLSNQDEVDAYLHQRDKEADRIHRELKAMRPDRFNLIDLLSRVTDENVHGEQFDERCKQDDTRENTDT